MAEIQDDQNGQHRSPQSIRLEGVRVHNLQSIDLELPLRQLIVVTGVSGSGKSSLAFDTLFAEGQRRYIESFSTYARQFLDRLEKPDADRIDHIPPAIAVRQHAAAGSGKSTVASATEIHDFLRLLFARIGKIVCPGCGSEIVSAGPADGQLIIAQFAEGTRFQIGFPLEAFGPQDDVDVDDDEEWPARMAQAGFTRAVVDGHTVDLRDAGIATDAANDQPWIIVDRLVAGKTETERVVESLEIAFEQGEGRCFILAAVDESAHEESGESMTIDEREWRLHRLNRDLVCEPCQRTFQPPEPRLFSANSPLGACPACHGEGSGSENSLEQFEECSECHGARLQPNALAVRIDGVNIAELCHRSLADVNAFFAELPQRLTPAEQRVTTAITAEAVSRLKYLQESGLGYLALDRPVRTLSGGESRRVALTAALGSSLVNTLYVLDEPSAGLHPRDNDRVIAAIRRLRDSGNSVVVVEHDPPFMAAADELIDIGPGAGRDGGRVIFQGKPADIGAVEESVTGDFAAGRRAIPVPAKSDRRKSGASRLRLEGVQHHNLHDIVVEFPLGVLCVVTGVSGSGKSSLVHETLYPALCRHFGESHDVAQPGAYRRLSGCDDVDAVVLVDPAPSGRTRRSVPVTYLKVFDVIRNVFAETREAKARNFTATAFSFNSARGGRCPSCQGRGTVDIDMQFLADITMTCAECRGRRYRQDVLEVKYRGRNIADVLDMTVREAFTFFRTQPKLLKKLQLLSEVGLDYLPLGQPATTLSGGELQRLKLASFLSEGTKSRTLFLIDEPTIGLHAADVQQLLACFAGLLAVGHSLIVVEHNLDVIKSADYVIDLGPEAGDLGGRVVAAGTPEEIAGHSDSITGEYLRTVGVSGS